MSKELAKKQLFAESSQNCNSSLNPQKNLQAARTCTKIHIQITEADIKAWHDSATLHPLVAVLKRSTQTNWRLVEPIMLVEKTPPFRTAYLGSELMLKLLDCKNGERELPLNCEVELISPFYDSLNE